MSDSASHELQKLETQMNLALFKVAKEFDNDFEKAMIAVIESGLTGATSSGYAEPKTVSEARNQTDWKLWEATITKEHNSMLEKKVWTPRKLEEVPKNCRILGSKWVFKLKEGPLHRATLISQGFNQIPGVDFTDAYAPVVQDITLRMLLTLMIVQNMKAEVIDVETAFLYGKRNLVSCGSTWVVSLNEVETRSKWFSQI